MGGARKGGGQKRILCVLRIGFNEVLHFMKV